MVMKWLGRYAIVECQCVVGHEHGWQALIYKGRALTSPEAMHVIMEIHFQVAKVTALSLSVKK